MQALVRGRNNKALNKAWINKRVKAKSLSPSLRIVINCHKVQKAIIFLAKPATNLVNKEITNKQKITRKKSPLS